MKQVIAPLGDSRLHTAMQERVSEELVGEVVEATVVSIDPPNVLLNLGDDQEGLTQLEDLQAQGQNARPGTRVSVFVDHVASGARQYMVSAEKAQRLAILDRLASVFERGATLEGEIVSASPGGFNVDVGMRAFLPASQFGLRPVRDAEPLLGQRFSFRIIRFQKRRQNIVLSRRVLLEEDRDEALSGLKVGAIVEGVVQSFEAFGAFVDVGGAEGLLHVSDISWGRIQHPSEKLEIGQQISLKILKFEKRSKRLSLGLKQAEDDPWLAASKKYPVGTEVLGVVVSKTDFGCFIELEPGLEGLVHSSGPWVDEVMRPRLRKAQIGEELSAKVLDLDVRAKRMSLGLVPDEPRGSDS